MEIKVNGEPHALAEGRDGVHDLLLSLGIGADQPGIALAVNMTLVPRSEWAQTRLHEGDEVELITARQGG